MLQSLGSQRVGHNFATEQQQCERQAMGVQCSLVKTPAVSKKVEEHGQQRHWEPIM